MDFMEDSAVEGFYYKLQTTALEAQRIGIQIVRDAVVTNVLLVGGVFLLAGIVVCAFIWLNLGHSEQVLGLVWIAFGLALYWRRGSRADAAAASFDEP